MNKISIWLYDKNCIFIVFGEIKKTDTGIYFNGFPIEPSLGSKGWSLTDENMRKVYE